MADIVERLRGKHRARTVTLPDILHEAADEIERLKETYPYSELDMDMRVEAVTKDLKAKNERLRGEVDTLLHDMTRYIGITEDQQNTIDRLRERVAELQAQCGYLESIAAVNIQQREGG